MKTIQYVGLALVTFVASVVFLMKLPPAGAEATVQLETTPPLTQVLPGQEPVQIRLQALNPQGQPLANARFQVRLVTPAKTPWLSTDLPIVEGTTLLELESAAPRGSLEFSQVLPIRGTYRLEAAVVPAIGGTFQPFEQRLTLSLAESPLKFRNLGILLGVLLAVGFAGGWVIGGEQTLQPGEIAPQPVRLLLSAAIVVAIGVLLYVNITAEFNHGHAGHGHHGHEVVAANTRQTAQGITAELTGEAHAIVGQLATQGIQLTETATGKPVTDALVQVTAIDLEHQESVFAYEASPDATGRLTWKQQFYDGAPHQVTAKVSPLPGGNRQFAPLQVSREIEVEAVEPPLLRRLISLGYFTIVLVAGLVLGLLGRRRSRPRLMQISG